MVPPEVRWPQLRDGWYPIIPASCWATSVSSRVVTGEISTAMLFGLYNMVAK